MRIRLKITLPVVLAAAVAIGFLVAGLWVGDAIRGSLTTIPGLTAERAVEAAGRVVVLAGLLAVLLATLAGLVLARSIADPLDRLRRSVGRGSEADPDIPTDTPFAEIQDVAAEVARTSDELRAYYGRQRQERAELAALVEAVSEGIIQLAPDGRVVRLNRASRQLLGLPEAAEGIPASTLFRDVELRRLLEQALAGEAVSPSEVTVDDQRILVSATAEPGGGAVVTLVDLTDLRRLEEVRRDFVANASHELKTPLTSIRGYTETLLSGGLPDSERDQFLATISRNAERLQRIVDDLLDLSRLETGRWEPDLEPVDIGEVAEASWHGFADRAASRDVGFSVEAEAAYAVADRRALDQVFANLFDNALRYTDGGGRISVTARSADAPPRNGNGRGRFPSGAGATSTSGGSWLVVDVADTGTGIPRDALPRIFERFYRVDPARSRAEGGTGLGLSIVKHMLESMGGGVEARSELGKGTTIRFWLPAPE